MSAAFRGILLISALVWMHLATCTELECDFTFNIPSLVGSVLNVEEKSNVSFNFTFGSTLCRITDGHVINVAKLDDSKSKHTVCKILHVNTTDQCRTSPPCRCFTQSGLYGVNKVFDRTDITTWILWEEKKHRQKIFNISNLEVTTEPPLSSSDVTTHADFDSTVTVAPSDLTTRDQSENGTEISRGGHNGPTSANTSQSDRQTVSSEDESSEDDTTTATLAAAFSVAICVVVAIFVYSRFRKRNTVMRPGTCHEIPDEGQGVTCQRAERFDESNIQTRPKMSLPEARTQATQSRARSDTLSQHVYSEIDKTLSVYSLAKVVEEEQPSDDGEQAEMIVNTAYEGGNVSVEHNTTDGNDASDCSLRLLQDNGSLEDSASSASALVSNAAESGAATGDCIPVTDLPKLTTRQMEQGAEHNAAESGAANGDYIAINDIPELTVLK